MHTILKNTIVFILLFISFQLISQEATKPLEWIILKDKASAYQDKKMSKNIKLPVFKYLEKVYGTLIKDSLDKPRTWMIEVTEGNNLIYFPYPELVQNIELYRDSSYPIGQELVDIKYPLPMNYKPKDLELIDQKWNYHGEDYPKYLRKEVIVKLLVMLEAARSENIHLRIVSAFRTFEKQRSLYLRAISKKGIHQIGTAKPAHSEHQLGTTIDITSLNRKDMLSSSFDQTPEGRWLKENAHLFGFTQSYTKENSINEGYMPEPWHFRYLGPNSNNHDNKLH